MPNDPATSSASADPAEALVSQLRKPLLALAGTDPAAAWRVSGRLTELLLEVEGQALRTALEAGQWLEARAAAMLGVTTPAVRSRLRPGGPHGDLGTEARVRRAQAGMARGRPPGT